MFSATLLRKQVALTYTLAIVCIIVAADEEWAKSIFLLQKAFPFSDTLGHFVLIGGLTYVLNTAYSRTRKSFYGITLSQVSWCILVCMTIEEGSQFFFPSRTPDLLDLAANYAGIFVFDRYVARSGTVENRQDRTTENTSCHSGD